MDEQPYYLGAGRWPNFEIRGDDIDGPFPTTYLDSWKDFSKIVSSEKLRKGDFIFRGHRRNTWGLVPSIARNEKGEVVRKEVANRVRDSFKLASRGRVVIDSDCEEPEDELWAQGQHHGLMTPLLDWTLSPYVALFFAFEKPDYGDSTDSRVVFALDRTRIQKKVDELQLIEGWSKDQVVRIFQPESGSNRRLLSQAGLFTISPFGETIASWIVTHFDFEADSAKLLSKVVFKIHIPNSGREECLRHLNSMNINHASLFPDLIGASQHTNYDVSVYHPAKK